MHRLVFVIVLVLAAVAHAQLVPVMGMSAGCPSTWAHREGGARSFSCADMQSGSFCNGSYRAPSGATQVDEAAAARATVLAMGFVIRSERDASGMHVIEYDDAAGHRIAQFVRRVPAQVVVVTCGGDPRTFAAELPTFESIASTAR